MQLPITSLREWTLDTLCPTPVSNITISPDSGISNSDLLTNTRNLTISGNLPESDLTVFIFDKTNNTQLGQARVSGTAFSLEAAFSAAGRRSLEIQVTDVAGNTASSTFSLLIDEARPAITNLTAQTFYQWSGGINSRAWALYIDPQ